MCNRTHEADRRRISTTASAATLRPSSPDTDEEEEEEEDDDRQEPVWTFRVIFLGSISFFVLLILSRFFLKQTGDCVMAMSSALVVLYPLGYIMGKVLPKRMIYYHSLRLEFAINPGPFGLREYAVISFLANLGAVIGGITSYSTD